MEELVIKAKKGNLQAFQTLIGTRINTLYKIAFGYFRNESEASDLVQDSILIAFKNISKLKDNTKFNAWIAAILVNRCRELLRRTRRIRFEEYSEEISHQTTFETGEYERLEQNLDILNAMEKLEYKYREVLLLKYFGDYRISDIADILNIPQGTVKSRLNYGLNKLKEFLEVRK